MTSQSALNGVEGIMGDSADIAAGRLSATEYAGNFADIKPPLDDWQAAVESMRCLFCYDAPCIEACPTLIDIPRFMRMIATGNVRGAGLDILRANIMGGTCARVCPTEILCEAVCVRTAREGKPVKIGRLQRFATDAVMDGKRHPVVRGDDTGRHVAVVGAGPAGLACAHRLAELGHRVTIFEAAEKAGGLNEYGIAAYKMVDDFAGREVDFILGIGGIEVVRGKTLGRDVTLEALRRDFDAVFVGIGLGGTVGLGVEGEDLAGVMDAVAYIRDLRDADDPAKLAVGRRVVVVGGGNTAIDIAVQIRLLGAEDVTLVYRRGPEHMGATADEQALARARDVRIRYWARAVRIVGERGAARAVEFERTVLDRDGRVTGTGTFYTLDADMVFKAIGQTMDAGPLAGGEAPALAGGRIRVDGGGRTSITGVYAGGDCVAGVDLTVRAVRDGRAAADAIDGDLAGQGGSTVGRSQK